MVHRTEGEEYERKKTAFCAHGLAVRDSPSRLSCRSRGIRSLARALGAVNRVFDSRGPLLEQVDLSGYAGTPFQIRWRYSTKGLWCSYYQQIDNVKVTAGCRLKQGGLVSGRVRDGNTKKPLAEIAVTSDASETATTDDFGVYVLFSPAGVHTITATPPPNSGYGAITRKVSVLEGSVVHKGFALPAAVLSFNPLSLSATLYPSLPCKE